MDDELTADVWEGINLCRQGSWSQGLTHLSRVAKEKNPEAQLPGLFYSYFGHGIALIESRVREGLDLCEKAVKLGFYEPENYLNLSRTHLLRRNRRAAVESLQKGLKVDPNHEGLRNLQHEIGFRQSPVLPFLPRNNRFNIMLGKARHRMSKRD